MWHDRPMSSPPPTIPFGWSAAELATIAELAETFVRGGSVRRANLAAEALTLAADPAPLRQLRLVLRLLESRGANVLPGGGAAPVPARPPAQPGRGLLRWGAARPGLPPSPLPGCP